MKLTKKEFKTWLTNLNPNTVVGRSSCPYYCPFATYYVCTHTNSTLDSVVSSDIVYIPSRGKYSGLKIVKENPKWLTKFIEKLDRECGINQKVTAKQALEVLEGI